MSNEGDTAGERLHSTDGSDHSSGESDQERDGSQQSETPDEERASDWEDEEGGKQEQHLRLTS